MSPDRRIINKNKQIKELTDEVNSLREIIGFWSTKSGQMGNMIGSLREQIRQREKEIQAIKEERDVWTTKCGQMGNEIGSLRQQLQTKNQGIKENCDPWSTKCGQLGNEIGRLRQQIRQLELENQNTMEKSDVDSGICVQTGNEIDRMRQNIFQLQTENEDKEKELPDTLSTICEQKSNEIERFHKQIELKTESKEIKEDGLETCRVSVVPRNQQVINEKKCTFDYKNGNQPLTKQAIKNDDVDEKRSTINDIVTQNSHDMSKKQVKMERSIISKLLHGLKNLIIGYISNIDTKYLDLKLEIQEKVNAIDFYKSVCDAQVVEIKQLKHAQTCRLNC